MISLNFVLLHCGMQKNALIQFNQWSTANRAGHLKHSANKESVHLAWDVVRLEARLRKVSMTQELSEQQYFANWAARWCIV